MSNAEAWRTWEGRVVEGKFPLRKWLGGSDHSAVFLTERRGQASGKAAIKLIPAEAAEADRQLARWRAASQLSHPHLIRIFEAGRCRLDSTPVLYVVMDCAEEDLSQILPERALTAGEMSDLLPPLLDALSYLHGKGFVHSAIKPSNLLAAGDQLKLSSDQLASLTETSAKRTRRDVFDAPEMSAGIVSPASDVWSVGVTIVAALTQSVSFGDLQNDPVVPQTIPEPFRGIARECLRVDPKRRCSIAQIQARLQPAGRSVPAEPEPLPPPPRLSLARNPIFALLLIVAVIAGFVVFRSRGKNAPSQASEQSPAPQPAPMPASPAPVREEPKSAGRASASRGEVVHQVLPEVSPSAQRTISGTIKIAVRVEVGTSGKVTATKLTTAGPSRYFANLTLKAAQQWDFSPPTINGQPTTSTWLLRFRLRRDSIKASAEQMRR